MILFFRGLRDYLAALEKTSVCMFWKRVLFTLRIACLIAQPIISGGTWPCLSSLVYVRCVGMETFWSGRTGRLLSQDKITPQRLKWRTFDLRSVMPPAGSHCAVVELFCPLFFIRYFLCSLCAE